MSELRWPEVKELLADALELEPAHRPAYIARVCGENLDLRRRLEEFLAYEDGAEADEAGDERAPRLTLPQESPKTDYALSAGERWLGPYLLLERIGEGGMGTVYKAEQRYPVKRLVAIKLIKPGFDTEEVIARFESERQALARMDHPSIAKVFDAGVDDRGRPYFAMEYVLGAPIIRFADEAKLSINQRLELFTQVCDAIAHAHTKAIIHRDLKSSNILGCFVDGQPVAKTIDFGIAKALTGDRLTDHTFDTSRGQPIGTYESMSPEQAAGSPDIDTRTDVYSLGVLLYELLCGAKPFDRRVFAGADDQTIRRIIRDVEPQRPSVKVLSLGSEAAMVASSRGLTVDALARQLRSELEWIPMMAMRKDPQRRYRGAVELCADIRNYLNNRPLMAGPESRMYRLRKFTRRNRPRLLTTAALAIATIVAMGLYIRGIRLEQKKTQAALALVQSKHEEAGKQRDEARRQGQMAAAVNRFLSDMLTSADPYQLLGDKVTVLKATQEAVKQLDAAAMKDQPLVEASLRQTIGNTFHRLSRYDEAEPNLRRALELCQQVLPADDPKIAEALNDLGVLLRSRRNFSQAEQIHREALRIRRKLPAGDPAIAISLTSLASALQGQDRWWEAEQHYREALQIRREALPGRNRDVAEGLHNLAVILKLQRQFPAAEELFREALEMRRSVLSPAHPEISDSLSGLAAVLRERGKLKEAEGLSREALAVVRPVLPADHPEIIVSVLALAKTLNEQGKTAEAKPLFREAAESLGGLITAGRQSTETNAADLANNLHLLAHIYRDEGNARDEEALLREALLVSRSANPLDQWNVIKGLADLGQLLESQKKSDEAEACYRELLQTCRMALPPEDPTIVKYLALLTRCLREQKKNAEAADLIREAADINRKALPADRPHLAASLCALARLEKAEGNVATAERLTREAIEIYRRAYPTGHRETAVRLAELGAMLSDQGKLEEAEALLREAVEMDRKCLAPGNVAIGNDLSRLGRILLKGCSKLVEADGFLREALSIQREKLGVDALATSRTAGALAKVLTLTGHSDQAAAIRREYSLRTPSTRPTTSPAPAKTGPRSSRPDPKQDE
ncbi:MAG TPA: serine/threonine-protein kinase [Tepidisphaeraceae bacterium]|nr:serine/threonine-protein kinase [Tepidisphaeraceae bacterium]